MIFTNIFIVRLWLCNKFFFLLSCYHSTGSEGSSYSRFFSWAGQDVNLPNRSYSHSSTKTDATNTYVDMKRKKQLLKHYETVLTSVIQKPSVLYSGFKPLILSQNKAMGSRHTKVQLSWAICALYSVSKNMKLSVCTGWI